MREDILEHFGADPSRVVVIHNGIDPELFKRTTAREALDRLGVRAPYVLFVGRITDQKGIFHLLEAARRCRLACRWSCAPRRPTRRRSRSGCAARWPGSPT